MLECTICGLRYATDPDDQALHGRQCQQFQQHGLMRSGDREREKARCSAVLASPTASLAEKEAAAEAWAAVYWNKSMCAALGGRSFPQHPTKAEWMKMSDWSSLFPEDVVAALSQKYGQLGTREPSAIWSASR